MAQSKEHSNLIKEVLKKKGISQTWLARELGLSFSITNAYVCNKKYSQKNASKLELTAHKHNPPQTKAG